MKWTINELNIRFIWWWHYRKLIDNTMVTKIFCFNLCTVPWVKLLVFLGLLFENISITLPTQRLRTCCNNQSKFEFKHVEVGQSHTVLSYRGTQTMELLITLCLMTLMAPFLYGCIWELIDVLSPMITCIFPTFWPLIKKKKIDKVYILIW